MQITTDRSVLDRIPAERKANYHINPDATIHITRILRNMYQEPVRAVVREYISNAIDVHREHGVSKPIEVALPSRMTQNFVVRDFGPGLSEAEVEKLLLGYGSSGDAKRTSNEQIGGFGIGCKCAFAVSDAFTYTSWHNGHKQVWLCQLDDKDMGEAKLVSNTPSKEPSGLQIEIPIRDSQLNEFAKQTKLAVRFIDVPISVDGQVRQPDNIFDIRLHGPLNGNFKGSTWEFLKFKDQQSANELMVVMGDMWYPIDPAQVKGLDASKLQKVLKGTGNAEQLSCAFRVPIGSLSIAPTREGLQYDAHTCKSLKHIVTDVDRVLQEQAETLIEQEETQFNALDKAFEMYSRKVYTFKVDPKRGPYIKWQGRTLYLVEEFAIPAKPHASGAKLHLMTRDTYEDNGGRRYRYYGHSSPCVSKLATHAVELTAEHAVSTYPASSIAKVGNAADIVSSRPSAYGAYSYGSGSRNGVHIPIIAHAPKVKNANGSDRLGATEQFVFMRRLKVYITHPGVPVLFYARKMLKAASESTKTDSDGNQVQCKAWAPYDDGMFLVLEATPEQAQAFLKDYAWLIDNPNDVEALPVAESALKRAQRGLTSKGGSSGPRKRPNYELFEFTSVKSTHAPSENWDRVAKNEIPTDDYYGVFMSRMNPVPVDKPIDGVQPSVQFRWLTAAQEAMELLTGKKTSVYGIRLYQTHKPKIPDEFVNFYDAIKEALDKWLDPATIGQYPVHGTQLMLRFGHNNHNRVGSDKAYYRNISSGLFEEFDFDSYPIELDDTKKQRREYGRRYQSDMADSQVHLLDCVRIPESWQHAQSVCRPDSQLLQWGKLLETYLGPATTAREKELNKWQATMSALMNACDYATPREDHKKIHEPSKARIASMAKHFAPVHTAWQQTWEHYSCLRLFEDVPVDGKEFKAMLDYIQVIDNK